MQMKELERAKDFVRSDQANPSGNVLSKLCIDHKTVVFPVYQGRHKAMKRRIGIESDVTLCAVKDMNTFFRGSMLLCQPVQPICGLMADGVLWQVG